MNQSNLPAAHTREGREMIYYQWVPFILSLMALFFYIPRGVWNIFSSYSGLALADLMTAARKSAKTGADDPFIPSIASTLRKVHTSKVTRYGSNLFNLYVTMKILIFANLVLQFFYLNHFLGTEYTFWGAGIALDMLRGRQWQQSGHFPRVNMFNEKIFIFLWFWFAMLLFCTSINLFVWIRRRYSKTARKNFLYSVLTDSGLDTTEVEREEFYQEVVQDDGLLVLLLLDANGGRLQSSELAHQLWISKFPQNDDKTISTIAEDEAKLHEQLWGEYYLTIVTFCDLEVRELGGAVHRWSLQCVLMINMFNEKIFVFLWWWFCVLVFISILNLLRWLIRLSFDSQRSFITAVLESSIDDDFDTREVSEFCKKTLKTDGVTIVRLIEENATIYQAAEFTIPLWKEFIQKSK
ncbi:hypothetical protein GCK32_012380 [Trichostrongylus colubriformis]|uniref:Innexin n=1 Tax=Trichostrongylus colubriformis TaxID=6319 RepID=A0AAN8INF5_TRICO